MRLLFALLTSLAIAPAAMAQAKPVTTASGLVYESIKDGAGESPKATDKIGRASCRERVLRLV